LDLSLPFFNGLGIVQTAFAFNIAKTSSYY